MTRLGILKVCSSLIMTHLEWPPSGGVNEMDKYILVVLVFGLVKASTVYKVLLYVLSQSSREEK